MLVAGPTHELGAEDGEDVEAGAEHVVGRDGEPPGAARVDGRHRDLATVHGAGVDGAAGLQPVILRGGHRRWHIRELVDQVVRRAAETHAGAGLHGQPLGGERRGQLRRQRDDVAGVDVDGQCGELHAPVEAVAGEGYRQRREVAEKRVSALIDHGQRIDALASQIGALHEHRGPQVDQRWSLLSHRPDDTVDPGIANSDEDVTVISQRHRGPTFQRGSAARDAEQDEVTALLAGDWHVVNGPPGRAGSQGVTQCLCPSRQGLVVVACRWRCAATHRGTPHRAAPCGGRGCSSRSA